MVEAIYSSLVGKATLITILISAPPQDSIQYNTKKYELAVLVVVVVHTEACGDAE